MIAVALVLLGLAPSTGVTTDPGISAIISNVDSNRILNTATTLQNLRTRQSCSDQPAPGQGVTSARDFLFSQYSAIPGLQVRLDQFVHPNCPTAPTFNVIAWLPGKSPNRLVIIGGHYDSRTTNVFDSSSDAPGGNDAGAQAAVVLELARILAGNSFDATIVFMAFSGEEQGLFGSASIAANLNRYFQSPQVIAMLNTDIPGGDNTANTPTDLLNFRLYSSGIRVSGSVRTRMALLTTRRLHGVSCATSEPGVGRMFQVLPWLRNCVKIGRVAPATTYPP